MYLEIEKSVLYTAALYDYFCGGNTELLYYEN